MFKIGEIKMDFNCTCGHTEDEHGGDKELPGSTACDVRDCYCFAYEWDGEDEDED